MGVQQYGPISIDKMMDAIERVRRRLLRAVRALEAASIPYAVAGGNAVAAWVARIDEGAVRNTRDVDILVRREDLPRVKQALEGAGFVYRHAAGIDMFLDCKGASPRDAVHILFAAEKVREEYLTSAPEITDEDHAGDFAILSLEALLRMKLTSFRRKDQVHVMDLIEVGLIDETWRKSLMPELAERLQSLLDTPES